MTAHPGGWEWVFSDPPMDNVFPDFDFAAEGHYSEVTIKCIRGYFAVYHPGTIKCHQWVQDNGMASIGEFRYFPAGGSGDVQALNPYNPREPHYLATSIASLGGYQKSQELGGLIPQCHKIFCGDVDEDNDLPWSNNRRWYGVRVEMNLPSIFIIGDRVEVTAAGKDPRSILGDSYGNLL